MKKQLLTLAAGILLGMALISGGQAAANLTASPTSQTFYVNGQKVNFEAYSIHGNNFVFLPPYHIGWKAVQSNLL